MNGHKTFITSLDNVKKEKALGITATGSVFSLFKARYADKLRRVAR